MRNLPQPYRNPASTDQYVPGKPSFTVTKNTCKPAQLSDALIRAETGRFKLVMSRSAVRVRSSALYFLADLQHKRACVLGVPTVRERRTTATVLQPGENGGVPRRFFRSTGTSFGVH
jgi:hypothetical protein